MERKDFRKLERGVTKCARRVGVLGVRVGVGGGVSVGVGTLMWWNFEG